MTFIPTWTEYAADLGGDRSMWSLGLEPAGLGIERGLLPNLTRQTVQVRYFSFLSWVFWSLSRELGSSRRIAAKEQKLWRVRMENAFRVASYLRDPAVRGLVGYRWVRGLELGRETTKVSLTDPKGASCTVPYGAPFRDLGCAASDGRFMVLRDPTGVALAEAFDKQLRRSPTARDAIERLLSDKRDAITVADLRSLTKVFALRALEPSDPEHGPLVELFFRLKETLVDVDEVRRAEARSRSMGLMLTIAQQSRGTLAGPDAVHRLFAGGTFKGGRPLKVPTIFQNDWIRWQRYQERQHEKLSFYGLWRDVMQRVGDAPDLAATMAGIYAYVEEMAEGSDTLAEWLGDDALNLTVAQAQTMILKRVRRHADRVTPLPYALGRRILQAAKELPSSSGASLVMALASTALWELTRGEVPEWARQIHTAGGRGRLALAFFTRDTKERASLTLREYLHWLLDRCVMGQSIQVAVQKYLDQGEDRFFLLPDGGTFRRVRAQEPSAYLIYDGRRVHSSYRLMEGLSLIEMEGGIRITDTGADLLRDVIAYHEARQAMREVRPASPGTAASA